MSEAELIVERRRLKRRVTFWRVVAVLLAVAGLAALLWTSDARRFEDHVARVRIDGLITGDQKTLDLLKQVTEADQVKGVLLRIDSPGGTTAGSEAVYEAVRKLSEKKPVVAVMDTVAASGGYITALAADHIVARGNTITGSIGVIFSFPEVSKLLDTVGIRMEELKSGDLKAEPSPYKPVSEKARAVSMEMVDDGFQWFMGLVAERRQLPMERVRELSDGRVYTGRQALNVKLIDAIGGEEIGMAWLETDKKLTPKLPILDWEPPADSRFSGLGFSAADALLGGLGLDGLRDAARRAKLDGLLALWHPAQ
ncbi:MAG: signal peptide peptidase SppA [Aestuariivirga sp.]|jgi:protease-4|uniref:signal peptide peptidase SppA n=1 Tax=Aestuariivirga sp. TaxID=2650926 RepID=UPI0038D18E60